MHMLTRIIVGLCVGGWTLTQDAHGQEASDPSSALFFIEGQGGYGIQIGDTTYLPTNTGITSRYPLVHGYAFGGTAGVRIAEGLFFIGNYEYGNSRSVAGEIQNAADSVKGFISYHTAVLGLRMVRKLGPGSLRAELGAGLVFPFKTRTELQYNAALSQLPVPIQGTGTETSSFGLGIGGEGLMGYQIPIFDVLYLGFDVKLRSFQSNNNGETQTLRNFVTDFTAAPPTAVNADIKFSKSRGPAPSTYSVSDARVLISVGAAF